MARLGVDERREQLLALGLELFADTAYESLSIDAIAKAAGVSKGLLYHYFPGKRAFYVAVIDQAAEELLEAVAASETEGATPLELIHATLDAYLGFVETHAQAYRFLMKGAMLGDADVQATLDRARAYFREGLMTDGVDELAAFGIVGFCETVSLAWLDNRDAYTRNQVHALLVHLTLSASTAPIPSR